MRRALALLSLPLLLLSARLPAAAAGPAPWSSPAIAKDAEWSGTILLRQSVTVEPGAVLTVRPGTRVLAAPGVTIDVRGRLAVRGTAKEPAVFAPEKEGAGPSWEGIRLGPGGGEGDGHLLAGFRIAAARTGVSLAETRATLEDGTFAECGTGLAVNQKASAAASRVAFEGNDDGAVLALGGSATFASCRFGTIRGHGIVAEKGARAAARDCSFSRGKTGFSSLTNATCALDGCSFASLETAVAARSLGDDSRVSRCSFENNGTGILAVQYCAVEIADSSFRKNRTAVDVREFSAPPIRHNRFEGNHAGVSLSRKSDARVEGNVFLQNRNAVVVNYSSYPLIGGNNFERNDTSVRLEKFQSGDWERRQGSKGIAAAESARRGARRTPGGPEGAAAPDAVDARGNYWGRDPDRDPARGTMGKVWDGRRFGPVAYEGFEGTYAIDVVDVSGEKAAPLPDAGPRPPGAKPPAAPPGGGSQ